MTGSDDAMDSQPWWREKLRAARLYAITDTGYVPLGREVDTAARLLDGGADILQLRAKNRTLPEIQFLAERLQPLCETAGVPLVINDYPAVCHSSGAWGFHIGQDGGDLALAKSVAGFDRMAGRSTHSLEQATAGIDEGADYIGLGPLHVTPTKPGRPAIGLEVIAAVSARFPGFPVFCIGGITAANLDKVMEAGARRVVIVSDLLLAPDISGHTRAVRKRLDEISVD